MSASWIRARRDRSARVFAEFTASVSNPRSIRFQPFAGSAFIVHYIGTESTRQRIGRGVVLGFLNRRWIAHSAEDWTYHVTREGWRVLAEEQRAGRRELAARPREHHHERQEPRQRR